MWLGIAGTYRKHETVDVVYRPAGAARSRPAWSPSRTSQSEAAASSGWRDARLRVARPRSRSNVAQRRVDRVGSRPPRSARVRRSRRSRSAGDRLPRGRRAQPAPRRAPGPGRAAAARPARPAPPRAAFVRHSPLRAIRHAAPTTRPPATTSRRSHPPRLDELLRERSVLAEPRLSLQPDERRVELVRGRAPLDVASPAAEPRLEHDRELGRRPRGARAEEGGVRMRQAGEPERARGQQLVVGDDERTGRVPHVHAAGRRAARARSVPRSMPSRPSPHVEPAQRDVPRLEGRQGACAGRAARTPAPKRSAAATSASFVALRRWATTANLMPRSCGASGLGWA